MDILEEIEKSCRGCFEPKMKAEIERLVEFEKKAKKQLKMLGADIKPDFTQISELRVAKAIDNYITMSNEDFNRWVNSKYMHVIGNNRGGWGMPDFRVIPESFECYTQEERKQILKDITDKTFKFSQLK